MNWIGSLLSIFSGVGFFLNGQVLPNNSIALLSDIGEGSSALSCLTDRTQCCSTITGGERRGVWIFPNGSEVVQESMGGDIYHDRSYNSVILSRRNDAVGPTGIYTCEIPDTGNTNRILHIGVYNSENQGMT